MGLFAEIGACIMTLAILMFIPLIVVSFFIWLFIEIVSPGNIPLFIILMILAFCILLCLCLCFVVFWVDYLDECTSTRESRERWDDWFRTIWQYIRWDGWFRTIWQNIRT
jgi:RsiW-degrading membrane proteinase PrsW (M82 family)